jgi:hypothetical protein
MHRGKIINYNSLFFRVLSSNVIALSITALLMYSLREYSYSRTVVLGTAVLATILELIAGIIFLMFKRTAVQDYDVYQKYKSSRKKSEYEMVSETNGNNGNKNEIADVSPGILHAIERESGKEITEAIVRMTSPGLNEHTAVLSTTTVFNINNLPEEKYEYISLD